MPDDLTDWVRTLSDKEARFAAVYLLGHADDALIAEVMEAVDHLKHVRPVVRGGPDIGADGEAEYAEERTR